MRKSAIILLSLIVAGACTQQALQTTYDKQTTNIESFISSQMQADETATLTRTGGAYRLTLKDTLDPTRDSLGWNGSVTMDYALYVLTGSSVSAQNLVATSLESIATEAGWSLTDNSQFQKITLSMQDDLLEGLKMGLYGVQPQDEAYILFTGKYGYGSREQGTIPAKSALVYHVWIDSIE